jgi:release factor glutamine methyltransferase
MSFPGVAVRDALQGARTAIAASGSDSPALDAELLLAHALGVDRTALVLDPGREVTGPAVRAFQDAVRRRSVGHEPIAYILGVKGFRRLDLAVDGRVLVPRPETELLVEVGVELLAPGARVVDVGTGSGAIALALKDERPDLAVTGSDVSAAALAVARANRDRLGLEVELVEADLVPPGEWDAVLSNPPYIADCDRPALAADIVRHEPHGALFGGPDGLDVVRRLAVAAAAAPLVALEIGEGQAAAVAALLRDAGFAETETRRDLAGIERVVVGRR